MFGILKRIFGKESISTDSGKETTGIELIAQYKAEIKEIKIENQPFRLSGLLHVLTNKIGKLLQLNGHRIYYDVENEVGRYIVGDNDYIEQVLEILIKDIMSLNKNAEIILKITKDKNKFLVFDVMNEKGFMHKNTCRQYVDSPYLMTSQSENINNFVKAKKIVEEMQGSLVLKSSRISGTHYTFKIPFYEDTDNRSNQNELKKFLSGKKALFIGKDKYDTKRTQYIFQTYGIVIENMKLDDFERKKPDLRKYDMAILRSSDLTYKHTSFFKNIYEDKMTHFKIIIVHELFESADKMALAKSIAHAELYNPTVIGDVEEILHQIFILKSRAVKGISSLDVFNPDAFLINAKENAALDDPGKYRGANIAIVEDSKVDQRIIRNILTMDGVTVYCMNNGSEMIDLLKEKEIDIIFTDINMPVMDGLIMTKGIRSVKKWEKIPIISISSMAFAHELKEMQVAGMNASISKPIESEQVYTALDKFLIMTDKIRNRHVNPQQTKNLFNKDILDIDKGLSEAKSDFSYEETLLETMEVLRGSRASFERMIEHQEFIALGRFSVSALSLYEKIHAPAMIKMFKDLAYFTSQKQSKYLEDYIRMYRENWSKLEQEVEKYIENTKT